MKKETNNKEQRSYTWEMLCRKEDYKEGGKAVQK